jgi:hypothetical protein
MKKTSSKRRRIATLSLTVALLGQGFFASAAVASDEVCGLSGAGCYQIF